MLVGLFSLGINLLMLTLPLFMLQVYDRVITSRSSETLLLLALIAAVALLTLAALEGVRGFVLVAISSWFDRELSGSVLASSISRTLSAGTSASIQGLKDLSGLRNFLTGPSIFPLLDAPWTPIFLGVIFLLHPLLGWLALAGALVLLGIAILNEFLTRRPLAEANASSLQGQRFADATVRNADVLNAMGMLPHLLARWHGYNQATLDQQALASRRGAVMGAIVKFGRLMLQIAMLGVGAWLAIHGELSPGAMIAGSILMGRALAPVDQAIGFWKAMTNARSCYGRLRRDLESAPPAEARMPLPAPSGRLTVEAVSYKHPQTTGMAIRGVRFGLEPGEALGVVGPTAAGKSTLARLLVGNLAPHLGQVRLDGADMAGWDAADRGQHVGYLPQDVELFAGTIKENIARMSMTPDAARVIEAARLAGVHDLILRLPEGYETRLSERGLELSGGQRQRIGLARAVYGAPKFMMLDEPNANLDNEGEAALLCALDALKARQVTVVVITHRPSVLRIVDKILVLTAGAVKQFGTREKVLAAIAGPQADPEALDTPAPQQLADDRRHAHVE